MSVYVALTQQLVCSALSWTQLSPQLDEQHFTSCAHCRLTTRRHSGEKETRVCGELSALKEGTLACAQELQLVSCTCWCPAGSVAIPVCDSQQGIDTLKDDGTGLHALQHGYG